MGHVSAPVVITANALLSGEVVYLDHEITWQPELAKARIFDCLETAEGVLQDVSVESVVLGVYLAEVTASPSVRVRHYREGFRERGPSNYFHGKQASESSGGVA